MLLFRIVISFIPVLVHLLFELNNIPSILPTSLKELSSIIFGTSKGHIETFPLCVLWLIISSYFLNLHLLIVSTSLHKHCNILLYSRWIYSHLCPCILFLFHLFNRKTSLCSFYSFYTSILLNWFICISSANFCIY